MVERDIEVLSVQAHRVSLRLLGACRGCGTCRGRCGLVDALDEGAAHLALDAFPQRPEPGQRWRLALHESDLLQASRWAYGMPLLGLMMGAVLGRVGAFVFGLDADVATLIVAVAGTSVALAISKRAAPRLTPSVVPWDVAGASGRELPGSLGTSD